MLWIERVERVARVVLWLALASAAVLAPISYIRQRKVEAEQHEAARVEAQAAEAARVARELADKAEKQAEKPLSLGSMGQYLVALDVSAAVGNLYFTNVSARTGALCVVGVAENPATQRNSTSLPACHEVPAYGSTIHVPIMFAGSDLRDVCPTQSACRMKALDAK